MVNKGSYFADFVRFRPHTYNLHAQSAISARGPWNNITNETMQHFSIRFDSPQVRQDLISIKLNFVKKFKGKSQIRLEAELSAQKVPQSLPHSSNSPTMPH